MRNSVPVSAEASSALTHEDVLARLYRWVARRSHEQDVCDLCQEVVAVALEKFDSFDPRRSDFCAWLWGIAKNVLANYRAGQLRYAAGDVPEYTQLREPTPNAEVRMESRELFAELTAKIDPMDVEILMAHRVDGLTFAQIGQEMHMSANAARKRYARARAALEKAWQKHQATRRSRGLFVLPIAASVLLEAERARCADVPSDELQRIREAIEPLVQAANGPVSHQRPVSRQPASTSPVDAFAPDFPASPWLPWAGSLGAFFASGILAFIVVVALIPSHTHLTNARSDVVMLQPAPETSTASASRAEGESTQGSAPDASKAVQRASTPRPAHANVGPTPVRNAASTAERSNVRSPATEPLAYTLLRAGTRAVERGDLEYARSSLAAYDAKYPHDPFPTARVRLARRIADLERRLALAR